MWRWRADVVVVGVDRQRVACWDGTRLREAGHGATGAEPPSAAALQAALAEVLDGRRPGRLAWCVGADLCRHWVFDVPAAVRSFGELTQLAKLRAAQLFGPDRQPGNDWVVSADWRAEGRVLAGALPRAWLAGMDQAARALGASAQVWSALELALNEWPRHANVGGDAADRVVAWATPDHLALGLLNGEAVQAWRCVRRPAGLPHTALVALATGEAAALCASLSLPPLTLQFDGVGASVAPWRTDTAQATNEAAWAAGIAAQGLSGVAW